MQQRKLDEFTIRFDFCLLQSVHFHCDWLMSSYLIQSLIAAADFSLYDQWIKMRVNFRVFFFQIMSPQLYIVYHITGVLSIFVFRNGYNLSISWPLDDALRFIIGMIWNKNRVDVVVGIQTDNLRAGYESVSLPSELTPLYVLTSYNQVTNNVHILVTYSLRINYSLFIL